VLGRHLSQVMYHFCVWFSDPFSPQQSGNEVDPQFLSTVTVLSKHIDNLQTNLDSGVVTVQEFEEEMTHIEGDLGQIDNQLGLSAESEMEEFKNKPR
jgi:hypothetical protein